MYVYGCSSYRSNCDACAWAAGARALRGDFGKAAVSIEGPFLNNFIYIFM